VSNAHEGYVRLIVPLQDGTIVSCSYDKSVKRWSVKSKGLLLNTYRGHMSCVRSVAELSDDTFAAGENEIRVWHKDSNECLAVISVNEPVWSLLKLKNKSKLLCGMSHGAIEEIDISDLTKLRVRCYEERHALAVLHLCELPDGKVVSASDDWTIEVWDTDTRKSVDCFLGNRGGVLKAIQLRNGLLASVALDRSIKVRDLSKGVVVATLTHDDYLNGIVEAPDGSIVSFSFNEIQVWNHTTKDYITAVHLKYEIGSMALLADEGLIITGGQDGCIEARQTYFKLEAFSSNSDV